LKESEHTGDEEDFLRLAAEGDRTSDENLLRKQKGEKFETYIE